MKIIEPSVEYWQQGAGIEGVWNQIARATRVCYQSKPREGESSEDFVKRIILKPALIEGNLNDLEHCKFDFDKMHGAMLEHGTVYLDIDYDLKSLHELFMENPYSRITYDNSIIKDHFFVTTNMRVIIENNLFGLLEDWMIDTPTEYHAKRYTFSVITDIGVTREFNRHRTFSVAEQSTRYCTYSADKFGNEITYTSNEFLSDCIFNLNWDGFDINSDFFYDLCEDIANNKSDIADKWTAENYYIFGLLAAEFAYLGLKKNKVPNDIARQVLNLNTKSQVVYTAFDDDWQHFIKLRADNVSGKVHPNMKIIADKIKELSR